LVAFRGEAFACRCRAGSDLRLSEEIGEERSTNEISERDRATPYAYRARNFETCKTEDRCGDAELPRRATFSAKESGARRATSSLIEEKKKKKSGIRGRARRPSRLAANSANFTAVVMIGREEGSRGSEIKALRAA
jgi:hypothetical protein